MVSGLGELRSMLDSLTSKECWSVLAGAGTGATVHLLFGDRILRRAPLRNPQLTGIERKYDGEFDLFVSCAWRLEHLREVVCGSTDDSANDGPMVVGLSRLLRTHIVSVEMLEPVPDLTIVFSNGYRLTIFCDQTNLETNDSNYSVRILERILVVGARAKLVLETITFP